jgi:hypothetical protein
MSESFDIVLSRHTSPEEMLLALSSVIPLERLRVQESVERVEFDPEAFSATVDTTADPLWPRSICVWVCPNDLGLGSYPELRIATALCHVLKCNALCGVPSFIEDVDSRDPYYSLALLDGSWHLVSTAGTPLMGPYTDGKVTFPGDAAIRFVRLINLPANIASQAPNPSIERTSPGKPGAASHVKR